MGMQTIGLIGGMSWHSTRGVLPDRQRARRRAQGRPRLGPGRAPVARLRRDPRLPGARRLGSGRPAAGAGGAAVRAVRCRPGADLHQPHAPGRRRRRGGRRRPAAPHRRRPRRPRPRAGLVAAGGARHHLGDGGGLLRRPAGPARPHRRYPWPRRPRRGRPGDLRRADPRHRARRVAGVVRRHPRPAPRPGCRGGGAGLHRDRAADPARGRAAAAARLDADPRRGRRRSGARRPGRGLASGPRPWRRGCPWPWVRPRSPSGRCPRRRGRSHGCSRSPRLPRRSP